MSSIPTGINHPSIPQGQFNLKRAAVAFAGTPAQALDTSSTVKTVPADVLASSVRAGLRFSGQYQPGVVDLVRIQQTLTGWANDSAVMGPNYFANEATSKALLNVIRGEDTPSNETIATLANAKARAMNMQSLALGRSIRPMESYQPEASNFIADLRTETAKLTHSLKHDFGFGDKEVAIFHNFVAETAPILFTLGYPDAVGHCAQVAMLCVIQADKHGATKSEKLQAALVGWLHDPKLPNGDSWSNLATHPIVGSAIAHDLLNRPDMKRRLKSYLRNLSGIHKMSPERFTQGVVEALSINNDSKFVLNNVILHKPPFPAPGQPEPGVAEAIPELDKLALARFDAPGAGKPIKGFSLEINEKLSQLSMQTGLRGVSATAFAEALAELADTFPELIAQHPQAVFNNILNGNIENKELIEALEKRLAEKEAFVQPTVRGDKLFSHHMDVSHGRIPALALAESDPMSLSAHKIIEARPTFSILTQIRSFMGSFEENILGLPKQTQAQGRLWQRDMYRSMLEAAAEVTGKNPLDKLPDNGKNLPLSGEIKAYAALIVDEDTWKNAEQTVDYGSHTLAEGTPEALKAFNAIREHYIDAANNSSALFGILKRTAELKTA